MRVTKAVITAAGRGAALYPAATTVQKAMLPVVDRDGLTKPVIQVIAEEAIASGIDEVCLVCAPGDEEAYLAHFAQLRDGLLAAGRQTPWAQTQAARIDDLLQRLSFAVQAAPLGYGHAVACARAFTRDEPFLLLLGDHLYLSRDEQWRCAEQLLAVAAREACAVAAVQPTREHLIGHYGTLTGAHLPSHPGVYTIERIIEKPSLSVAETELLTPRLRTGYYLCFFGMHVLTPTIFELLAAQAAGSEEGAPLQLTPALQELAYRERFLALEVQGIRYDLSQAFGLLQAQVAFGLAGVERQRVLTTLTELLIDAQV